MRVLANVMIILIYVHQASFYEKNFHKNNKPYFQKRINKQNIVLIPVIFYVILIVFKNSCKFLQGAWQTYSLHT